MGDGQPRLLDQVRDGIRRKITASGPSRRTSNGCDASCCIITRGTPATWGRRRSTRFRPTWRRRNGCRFFWVPDHVLPDPERPVVAVPGRLCEPRDRLLHVVVVLIGPDAHSFFGGPGLARQAESGSWQPALMTLVLAWLFVVFAAYGLSGAGVIRRLPLLRYNPKLWMGGMREAAYPSA